MKKFLKIVAIIFAVGFIAIQFFRPDFTNPPFNQAEVLQTPENIQKILRTSCYDCHSHETVYPWYAKVQPSAWFLADHINEGRRHLNFSVWNTYEPRRQAKKLEEICEEVKGGYMPLPSYLWIHWDAKLNEEQVQALCDWTNIEKSKITG
jgi:hypothetical protein